MSVEEIKHKLVELKTSLMQMRFQKKIGQLTDTSKFSTTKKDIARLMTMLTEKENGKK